MDRAASFPSSRTQIAGQRPIGRLVRLDGLRGVLAVYVMLGHAEPFVPWGRLTGAPWAGRVAETVLGHGLAAVDLFFALSGMVIVQSLIRFEGRALPFLRARFWRLMPVYLVVLAVSILLVASHGNRLGFAWLGDLQGQVHLWFWPSGLPRPFWAYLLAHLTMVHGALPPAMLPHASFTLLGPAWSLSTEWQFYALIALVIGLSGHDPKGLGRLALGFMLLALAGRLYAAMAPAGFGFTRAFLPNQAIYFALGIASAQLWQTEGAARRNATALLAVVVVVAVGLGLTSAMPGRGLTALGWLVAIAAARVPSSPLVQPLARMPGHPVMLFLGAVSYPLYLGNEPIQQAGVLLAEHFGITDPTRFALFWLPVALFLPVGVAWLLHRGVERRFMRRRRPRSPAAVHPVAPRPAASPGPVPARDRTIPVRHPAGMSPPSA